MHYRIIEPVKKHIYLTRLADGTYYQPEAANQQPTEAKSPVIKTVSHLYPLLVSLNKPVPLYITSISGGYGLICSLIKSPSSLIKSSSSLIKPSSSLIKPSSSLIKSSSSLIKPSSSLRINQRSWGKWFKIIH